MTFGLSSITGNNRRTKLQAVFVESRQSTDMLSAFLRYLARYQDGDHLPSLREISLELGVSQALLREQLEVAKSLGLVDVRPKVGIRRLPYSFRPAVLQSLAFSVSVEPETFQQFSVFRNHIEAAYWFEAVASLTEGDLQELCRLVEQAEAKLCSIPVQIPVSEHRDLHLGVYRRLNNPFVLGTLEAYWDMYEAVGMSTYADLNYLHTVWRYHRRMVESLQKGDAQAGYRAMMEHADLLYQRPRAISRQKFE